MWSPIVPLNTAAIVLHKVKGYCFMVPLLARFLGAVVVVYHWWSHMYDYNHHGG